MEDALRLDKWLWAARFFKTRVLATEAVKGGKVHLNGGRCKPSRAIQLGDHLSITKGETTFLINVLALNKQRRPAPEAQLLYEETEESRQKREQTAEMRRMQRLSAPQPTGRPDKKSRRQIIKFRQQ